MNVRAAGLPTSRGVEHLSMTVADLDEASATFADLFGCQVLYTMGPFRSSRTSFMRVVANADVRSVVHRLRVLRSPFLNVELFEASAPRQRRWWPDLLDVGGWGLRAVVDDLDAAVAHLEGADIYVLDGADGNSVACMAPWGLHVSLIRPTDEPGRWDPARPDRGARPTFQPGAGAVPGFRGFEGMQVTVADLEEASETFEHVLGLEPLADTKPPAAGMELAARANVDARAAPSRGRMLRSAYLNVELLECPPYPGQDRRWPGMFDVGGWHLAFYVEDLDRAAAALAEHDVVVLGNKKPAYDYEAGDEAYTLHALAPFGLYFELLTYPHGRYREAEHTGVAWHPARPAG